MIKQIIKNVPIEPYKIYPDGVLYNANCLEIMKFFPDKSVDLVLTDPPYGLKFMGKDWDKAIPSVSIWKECLRVLKDGAFAFIMSSPRQDCLSRMIVNLGDAGFSIGFSSIEWCYSSGFPKAINIEKKILKDLAIELKNTYNIDKIEWED